MQDADRVLKAPQVPGQLRRTLWRKGTTRPRSASTTRKAVSLGSCAVLMWCGCGSALRRGKSASRLVTCICIALIGVQATDRRKTRHAKKAQRAFLACALPWLPMPGCITRHAQLRVAITTSQPLLLQHKNPSARKLVTDAHAMPESGARSRAIPSNSEPQRSEHCAPAD